MKNEVKNLIESEPSVVFEIRQGIERECLRVDQKGRTSLKAHPLSLGSKLTHGHITTDYSENLLEFITSVHHTNQSLLQELNELHRFTVDHLEDELLWPSSMPGILPAEEDIPIAYYGETNIGKLKTLYRKGLAKRYGSSMQSIAGLHFNFSLSDQFWLALAKRENHISNFDDVTLKEFKNKKYFHLIRNFRRYRWFLMYFFGASNTVHESFLVGKKHQLQHLSKDTYYDPSALSLRMGGLGYTSSAQDSIQICFNKLETYIETLEAARLRPYPEYEKIGVKNGTEYMQLNTHLLQIDNEFYSTIRPKNIASAKESALKALYLRGVEYIEVRLLDINPFQPVGISKEQINFLHLFLFWCLQEDSPNLSEAECLELEFNFKQLVTKGREKNIKLVKNGVSVFFKEWGKEILDQLGELATRFSAVDPTYKIAHDSQCRLFQDPDALLANRILNGMGAKSFTQFNLELSQSFKNHFTFTKHEQIILAGYAKDSIAAEAALRKDEKLNFDDFLEEYFQNILIDFEKK